MATNQSLNAVLLKLAITDAKKRIVLFTKRNVGGFNGGGDFGTGSVALPPLGQPISPPGFPPFPPISSLPGPGPPIQFQPIVRDTRFDPQPTIGGGGVGAAVCNLLSGTARDLCLLGLQFIPPGGDNKQQLVPDCPRGMVKVRDTCVDLTALPPGGDPAFIPAGNGTATIGAFGLPALTPQGITRVVRKCARGMVLGIDNLCYPKVVLPGRNKFRKWRRAVRPPVTRRDVVAIRRAAGARDRVKELAKDVGLKIGSSRKKKSAAAVHHEK